MAPYAACRSYEVEFADGGVTGPRETSRFSGCLRRKLCFWSFVFCNPKEVWSCNSNESSGDNCVFEVLSAAVRRKFGAVFRRKLCVCSLEFRSVSRKKVSGEHLRRKLCFVCNSKTASGVNCVFDVLSKFMLKPHIENIRKRQVQAVFLDFVCCNAKQAWSCNSKEVAGGSCVFDVLTVCNSTEASAVIRSMPQVKALFSTFV